jgi:hypothetical protein
MKTFKIENFSKEVFKIKDNLYKQKEIEKNQYNLKWIFYYKLQKKLNIF